MDRAHWQKILPLVRGHSTSEGQNKTACVDRVRLLRLAAVSLRTGLWRLGRCSKFRVAVARARFAFLSLFGTTHGFFVQTECDKHPVAGF